MAAIGDPYTQATPRAVKGKPGPAFYTQLTAVLDELKARTSVPVDSSTLKFDGDVKVEAVSGGAEVTGDLDVSGTVTGATVAATGDVTAGDDVIATGDVSGVNLTATAAVQGATVSGTTSVTTAEDGIRHGDRVLMIGAEAGSGPDRPASTSATRHMDPNNGSAGNLVGGTAAPLDWAIPIPLCVGDRIKSVVMYGRDGNSGDPPDALRMTVKKVQLSDNTVSTIGSVQTSAGTSNTHVSLTVSGLTETVADTHKYFVRAQSTGTPGIAREVSVYGLKVTFDHPA